MEKEREFVDVKLDKKIFELLNYWNTKLKTQDNRGTATPIFIVQSKRWAPTSEDYCEREILLTDCEGSYLTIERIKDGCMDDTLESLYDYEEYSHVTQEDIDKFKELNSLDEVINFIEELGIEKYFERLEKVFEVSYWEDIAYFLTEEEAIDYTKYQAHNLGKCRTYAKYVGYSNRSSLQQFLKLIHENNIFEEIKEKLMEL